MYSNSIMPTSSNMIFRKKISKRQDVISDAFLARIACERIIFFDSNNLGSRMVDYAVIPILIRLHHKYNKIYPI